MSGVDIYGIISVCLFFAFFIGMLWWAFRLKKNYLDTMRDLPLEADDEPRHNPTDDKN